MRKNKTPHIRELKLPARASLWYLASAAVGKGFGFIGTIIFTRLLTPPEYGELTVYMSWLGIGEGCVCAFLSGSVIYKGLSDFKAQKREFISSVLGCFLLFSGAFCLLLFTFLHFYDFDTALFPFLLFQIVFDGIVTLGLLESKHTYSYRAVALSNIFEGATSLLISFLLIRYAGVGFLGRIIGYLAPTVAVGVFYLLRGYMPRLKKEVLSYFLPKVFPLIPSAIALAVTAQTDKLITNSKMGVEAAAKYSVVHSVGIGGVFLVGTLASALHPWLTRKLSAGHPEKAAEITEPLLKFFAALSLATVAIAPLAVRFLAPAEYSVALPAIVPLALSIIPYFAANLNTVSLIFLGKGGAVSRASVISGIVGAIANFALIPLLGYTGAGLSALISSSVSYFVGAFYLSGADRREILPKNSVIKTFIYSSALSIGIYFAYSVPYIIPLLLIAPALSVVTSALSAKQAVFE